MLAGTLRQAGIYMGRVLDNPFALNPTGLQEPEALIWMHENLLEANGGAWHEPPAQVTWGKLHKAVRDLFIESRHGQPLWAFKEPRTLLVADGWIEALPDWTAVGIFRHPAEVAESMVKRNGFDMEKGLALWGIYNQRLLDLHRRHGFPIVEFTSDPGRMQAALTQVLIRLGLQTEAADAFYDAAIPRHFGAFGDDLPQQVADLLAELRSISL